VKNYPRRFPFIEVCHFNRKDYLKALWKADIVVGCHNGSNQWSLAAVEAVAAECIPLFNKSSFFPEMIQEAAPELKQEALQRHLYYRGTFAEKLEALLDNLEKERQQVKLLSRIFRQFYDWDNRAEDWIRCFDLADAAAPEITERSKAIREIEALLKHNGRCTKEAILQHLNWHPKSRQISWTKYRKYLRKRVTEVSHLPIVIFEGGRKTRRHSRQRTR
jgi:hypothetical protein